MSSIATRFLVSPSMRRAAYISGPSFSSLPSWPLEDLEVQVVIVLAIPEQLDAIGILTGQVPNTDHV